MKKLAAQTHKDRVHSFNAKLESLSEHHDIPKVSYFTLFFFFYCIVLTCHPSGWTWIRNIAISSPIYLRSASVPFHSSALYSTCPWKY